MLRRHRLSVPALLIVGVYVVALAVAAVFALAAGDLGALGWLTLFAEADEGVAVTWPNVLVLLLAGMPWAWALWQCLRGPLAGPPPELDRDTRRLRVALYAAAASWLFYVLTPFWPWWGEALDGVVMCGVVLAFHPVLGHNLQRAGQVRILGVLGYGGGAVFNVLDILGRPVPDSLSLICGLAALIWMILVIRAQRSDRRWQRATVRYGIAALVGPLVAGVVLGALASVGNLHTAVALAGVEGALMVIWLVRSGHDLADPRQEPERLTYTASTHPL
ncbi:hypothetical protein [Nonomuraea sp. NPDC049695]|uniref:hypothetical protein n=1 Tax=Nonomuraea sp. NPDC049695 TaxID=3154734 RepID=UPI00341E913C